MSGGGSKILSKTNKDFEDLSRCWNDYGKSSPYWSVLTNPEYMYPDEQRIEQFYKSGVLDANYVKTVCEKYMDSPISGKTIIDFGCGLGRISKFLIDFGLKVIGMDVSKQHLKLAKKQVKGDVKWIHIADAEKSIQDLVGKKVDLIVSFIVLQHNRPALMKKFVGSLLDALSKNGIAILHIPYEISGYVANSYRGHKKMEMHFVSVVEIKKLTRSCGCEILEIDYNHERCGLGIKDCVYILQKKPVIADRSRKNFESFCSIRRSNAS